MIRKIVLLACTLLGTVAFAQPRFVPDSEIKKTGEVLFQKPHTIVFGFTNSGNKPLHIKKVQRPLLVKWLVKLLDILKIK